MSNNPNVRTVDRMTTAIFEQDHDTLTAILADDVVLHFRGPGPLAGDHAGLGGFLEVFGWIFEATNGDIKIDTKFCVGTDEWVSEWEHGVLGRNGKTLESDNSFVYRFNGERIAEMWFFVGAQPDEAEAFFA